MFRKPLADIKTSAPLRNSDRKKLKQRVLQDYLDPARVAEEPELGDLLVPDGLLSVKFTTHSGELGVAYLSADGEPLWFSLGKGSNDLIPTVYTLWKKPCLLPHLSTPSAVIPVLQNGADLMAAGVVEMPSTPALGQLVSITQYTKGAVGPPLAVGRMAMSGEKVREEDTKGKAVYVLHVWKDKLWEMGGQSEPPEPEVVSEAVSVAMEGGKGGGEAEEMDDVEEKATGGSEQVNNEEEEATPPPPSEVEPAAEEQEGAAPPPLNPQEVTSLLRTSLIQAICTTLSTLPSSTYPLPSTTFYTQHILPARPAHIPSSQTPIDIKHSTHKNLTSFLRTCEKEGLLKLKESRGGRPGKGGTAGDPVQILSININHVDVQAHRVYRSIREVEARRERREEREAQEAKKPKEMIVTELWKPHLGSVRVFESVGQDTKALYTLPQIKETINLYVSTNSLVNANQQQFVNVDDLLQDVLSSKGGGEVPEFMKREELARRLSEKMQAWYRVEVDGKEPVLKKGTLHPISITIKIRQGRKACTLLTHFEPFLLSADTLAEELRHLCASATSVNPLPGGAKGGGMEVMIQGRQTKIVKELLIGKGVPAKWIEESDLTVGKKK
ncbi:uncharacterized protein FOMMEDRAFT_120229 [Fomitiporia mediterranea MF3/22]|uniref:uncharacterized protein n=1 Tax=Fomitiporia mediterranea (strain MF3/22) TaxID=694068 RepID=UPI0004408E74|nr:uncharacterized protein FOMMEDRAFT_120229 [Fomitiporia mediterranea MF3/22]EJD04970.1 hypothetical protein FOMMEDRAFT_120229 [Fomitiporia mediterranea MF3/22]